MLQPRQQQRSCHTIDVFRQLKGVMPELKSIYLRQDNTGCYHCALTIVTARQEAEVNRLCPAKMDFSNSRGKGLV